LNKRMEIFQAQVLYLCSLNLDLKIIVLFTFICQTEQLKVQCHLMVIEMSP
jgi:hypothetical protein